MGGKHKTFNNCDECGQEDYLVNVGDRIEAYNYDEDWCEDCIDFEQKKLKKQEKKDKVARKISELEDEFVIFKQKIRKEKEEKAQLRARIVELEKQLEEAQEKITKLES